MENGTTCTVVCSEPARVVGTFVCLQGIMRGLSHCLQTGEAVAVEGKLGGGLALNIPAMSQDLDVHEALSASAGLNSQELARFVVVNLADEVGTAASSVARVLQSAPCQPTHGVVYEYVLPPAGNWNDVLAKVEAVVQPESASYSKFVERVTSDQDVAPADLCLQHWIAPMIYFDEVARDAEGRLVEVAPTVRNALTTASPAVGYAEDEGLDVTTAGVIVSCCLFILAAMGFSVFVYCRWKRKNAAVEKDVAQVEQLSNPEKMMAFAPGGFQLPVLAEKAAEVERCGCGNIFMPDAVFCRKCGHKRLTAVHCACGNIFMPDAVFCRKCGSKRSEALEKNFVEGDVIGYDSEVCTIIKIDKEREAYILRFHGSDEIIEVQECEKELFVLRARMTALLQDCAFELPNELDGPVEQNLQRTASRGSSFDSSEPAVIEQPRLSMDIGFFGEAGAYDDFGVFSVALDDCQELGSAFAPVGQVSLLGEMPVLMSPRVTAEGLLPATFSTATPQTQWCPSPDAIVLELIPPSSPRYQLWSPGAVDENEVLVSNPQADLA